MAEASSTRGCDQQGEVGAGTLRGAREKEERRGRRFLQWEPGSDSTYLYICIVYELKVL